MKTRRLTRAQLLTEARRLDDDADELEGRAAHSKRRQAASLRFQANSMTWSLAGLLRLNRMLRAS